MDSQFKILHTSIKVEYYNKVYTINIFPADHSTVMTNAGANKYGYLMQVFNEQNKMIDALSIDNEEMSTVNNALYPLLQQIESFDFEPNDYEGKLFLEMATEIIIRDKSLIDELNNITTRIIHDTPGNTKWEFADHSAAFNCVRNLEKTKKYPFKLIGEHDRVFIDYY